MATNYVDQRAAATPRKRHWLPPWAAVAGGCIAVLIAAWALFGGFPPYQVAEQQNVEAIVQTLDHFMRAGVQNDVAASAVHLAAAPAPELSPAALSTLFQTRRDLFEGYVQLDKERYGVALRTGWNGTRAEISGKISYNDGTSRPFQAGLVKWNNQWKLLDITFN